MARLVRETLPLNLKQFLVVTKILTHAIKHRGKTAVEAEDQMLLAVAGEGGGWQNVWKYDGWGVDPWAKIDSQQSRLQERSRQSNIIALKPTSTSWIGGIGGRSEAP